MDDFRRHKRAFALFRPLAAPLMRWKFRYTFDAIPSMDTPFFLLCNHNTDLDPILVSAASSQQVYFVASEHIMRGGLGTKFLMRYFKPILHTKGTVGLQSSMEILRTLKSGHNVALFPEGNRSFNGLTMPIFPATGKLARRSGAAMITYRLEGGYFSQPRWSLSFRRGKLRGRLIRIYSPEDLKAMTDEEVVAAIEADLHEDAYATQQREHAAFRGKALARGLETTLFTCPRCRQIGTLHTADDAIFCDCGYRAVFDVYGDLTSDNGTKHTITEWDLWQQKQLCDKWLAADAQQLLFSDRIAVHHIDGHNRAAVRSAELAAYRDHFTVDGVPFTPHELQGVAVFSRNVLTVHTGAQYELRGDESFCALKYLYLYRMMQGKSETN